MRRMFVRRSLLAAAACAVMASAAAAQDYPNRPVTLMVGLPILLAAVAHKRGIAQTRRDHMILQFSGFIAVYVTLTIVGTYFRGQGLALGPYTIFAHQ